MVNLSRGVKIEVEKLARKIEAFSEQVVAAEVKEKAAARTKRLKTRNEVKRLKARLKAEEKRVRRYNFNPGGKPPPRRKQII